MKNIFKILTIMVLGFASVAPAFAGSVSWATPNDSRFGSINGLTGQSPVVSKSYTGGNYAPTSSANAGDKVAVLIYLHNNGNADSTNTRVMLSPVSSGSSTSFSFTGSVSGGGTSISGSTTVNLSSSQTLTYIPGSLRVGYDRASVGVAVTNDTAIFTGSGIALNTIPGMHTCGTDPLCHQAWVAVGFQVSNTQTNNTCTDPNATNYGGLLPCQYVQNQVCNDPQAINYGGSLPCRYQQYNYLNVYTDQYSWINQNTGSVVLNGHYNNGSNSSSTYFEYRKDGYNTRTVQVGTYYDNSRSFNISLYNLESGYYDYRACANSICGQWLSFQINQNNYPVNNQSTIQTLSAISPSQDAVTLDGYLNLNGCSSATTYFEYGLSGNYNLTTSSVARPYSGSTAQYIAGLSPNTTYTYRAVANACGNIIRGSSMSFSTTGVTTVTPTTTTTIIRNVTTNIGGGAQFLRLTIDNGRDTIVRGDELIYVVSWENVSTRDLEKLVLEVTMPEGLQVIYSDRGQIDRKANAVYVNIPELKAKEKDDMTIRARVNGTFKDNDPITARAIMAFENPINKAQENAIAYDSDTYLSNSSVLGASIFGLDFLPGSLAGWLLLILLLLLIVLVIRYAIRRREHHHYYVKDDMVPPGVTTTTTTSSNNDDYMPYRPTPKN